MASRSRQSSSQNTGRKSGFGSTSGRYATSSRSTSKADGGGGSHDRHPGTRQRARKEDGTRHHRAGDGDDIGLLYKGVPGGRIQINSEKHTQEIKVIGVSKICNIFSRALQYAW